jgi:hypothetical protein
MRSRRTAVHKIASFGRVADPSFAGPGYLVCGPTRSTRAVVAARVRAIVTVS